jgi:hypothetical protein
MGQVAIHKNAILGVLMRIHVESQEKNDQRIVIHILKLEKQSIEIQISIKIISSTNTR